MGQINIKIARQGQCQFQLQCTHTYINLKKWNNYRCVHKSSEGSLNQSQTYGKLSWYMNTYIVHVHSYISLQKRALYCILYMYRTTEVPSLHYACIIIRTKSSALGQLCRHVSVHYMNTCKVCSTITGHKNCCIFTY